MTPQEITNRLKVFSSLCNGDVHLIKEAATLIESQASEIKELQNSLNLAISKFQEIANSVADFTNKQE